jgi:HD-like signal output (HDOD) protein
MSSIKKVERVMEEIGDIPALPAIVSQVLRMTDDPSVSTGDVSDVIQSDPALTAKVLSVSNSSYYGMKQFVGTLKLALVILGVREVRNVVLGISVFDTLSDESSDLKLAEEIWQSSMRVAGLAKKMGTEMGMGLQGEEFTAGLLADIGKMGMLRQYSDRYLGIYREFRDHPPELYQAELKEFGFTNADVATGLALRWNLPDTLGDALWYQYPGEERVLVEAKDPSLCSVTRIAKLAASTDISQESETAFLDDEQAWAILASAKRPIPEGDRRATLAGFLEEIEAPRDND